MNIENTIELKETLKTVGYSRKAVLEIIVWYAPNITSN